MKPRTKIKILTGTSVCYFCYTATIAKEPNSIKTSLVNLPSCLFILFLTIAKGWDASKFFSQFGHRPCQLIIVRKLRVLEECH